MPDELKPTEAVHTPGPWRKCGGYTPHYIGIAAGRTLIVESFSEQLDMDTQNANARLVAAAPELLAEVALALSDLEANIADGRCRYYHRPGCVNEPCPMCAHRDRLKALIAKATLPAYLRTEASRA